jgi:hypothetical protein
LDTNPSLENIITLWKSCASPSEELIAIARQKFNLLEGKLDKDFWNAHIVEVIHDSLFLELIPAETALELLRNCFESRAIEFQMIFISNWMLASKHQAFAERNLFDEIQKVCFYYRSS